MELPLLLKFLKQKCVRYLLETKNYNKLSVYKRQYYMIPTLKEFTVQWERQIDILTT